MGQTPKEQCRLCHHEMTYFSTTRQRDYYRCSHCDSIQLKSSHLLDNTAEKSRYDTHNNDIDDEGYIRFVSPITKYVLHHFNQDDIGLDFGAGPGPVIANQLMKNAYHIQLYDPYYHPDHNLLKKTYDYIIACEVIEHFNFPQKSFKQLNQCLNKNGEWIFMTYLYDDSIAFNQWHYKNDETHVIFYTKKTLDYIKNEFRFDDLFIQNRLIVFKKKTA